jgi:asparagine synthase (glutamine-hydrolysing)
MCGIAGFWENRSATPSARAILSAMGRAIVHRGPDDEGIWLDAEAGIGFSHRRLSIVDLSPHGRQPMTSASGRYVVVYNGEIYNFGELRKTLDSSGRAPAWRGHSDTEVVLAAIEAFGLDAAIRHFVGMFAFALWDREDRALFLARDRLGIKPLYLASGPRGIYFGSELGAILAHPGFEPAIDPSALASYLRDTNVPTPQCIYRNAIKVEPGTYVELRAPSIDARRTHVFWSAQQIALEGSTRPFRGSEDDAIDAMEGALEDAVRLRMIADVPLGAFLSGGIDSSTVVALMQAQSDRPVRTFSIRNEGADYDESSYAREVARHLGTEHTELTATAADAIDLAPKIAAVYDEPFGDSSQIPTFLVSKLAREHVTVALSGDGGDEVFGGYNRHVWAPRVWNALRALPRGLRGTLAGAATRLAPEVWDEVFARMKIPLRLPGNKVYKLARVFDARSARDLYAKLASSWEDPRELTGERAIETRASWSEGLGSYSERMMLADLLTELPDDILTKVDRASMAVSLEARVPLLDHRVVELAWRMPLAYKVRRGVGKRLLRRVLHRHVPPALVERPKMGFGIPVGVWLRGPLRDWAESLLDAHALEDAMLRPAPILRTWREHLSGRYNWDQRMWTVLMYMAWTRAQRDSKARAPRASVAEVE